MSPKPTPNDMAMVHTWVGSGWFRLALMHTLDAYVFWKNPSTASLKEESLQHVLSAEGRCVGAQPAREAQITARDGVF